MIDQRRFDSFAVATVRNRCSRETKLLAAIERQPPFRPAFMLTNAGAQSVGLTDIKEPLYVEGIEDGIVGARIDAIDAGALGKAVDIRRAPIALERQMVDGVVQEMSRADC